MHRVNIYKLMTWTRKHKKAFPFGISILNCIFSSLLTIILSIAMLTSLVIKQQYSYLPFLVLINLINIYFLVKVTTTNPGIIPQIVTNRQPDQELFSVPMLRSGTQDCKYLLVNNNMSLYNKYCYECKIFRPPRTIHCSQCNHCVQKYDHHCPWLSICIGRYNYIFSYFLGYIFSQMLLTVYSVVINLIIIVNSIKTDEGFHLFVVECVVGLISVFFCFPLIRLTIYHIFIMITNQTTNENLKRTYLKYARPSYQNLCSIKKKRDLFTSQSDYLLNKNSSAFFSTKSLSDKGDIKQIMLTSRLNDSTNQQSFQINSSNKYFKMQAHPYNQVYRCSIQTERNSVFNYLLENQQL